MGEGKKRREAEEASSGPGFTESFRSQIDGDPSKISLGGMGGRIAGRGGAPPELACQCNCPPN
ncbi:hypothetical protein Pmi06nite_33730 [Planotetraspora mira]|uniref:Uncharacterized protein n=1 Tax=Planotetraspora mira TaxID=58121 RepID=A0A8J3X749_9ACTN|nr:hypothetical protein Pmi06nite_33730 [Planotetraspora mira]